MLLVTPKTVQIVAPVDIHYTKRFFHQRKLTTILSSKFQTLHSTLRFPSPLPLPAYTFKMAQRGRRSAAGIKQRAVRVHHEHLISLTPERGSFSDPHRRHGPLIYSPFNLKLKLINTFLENPVMPKPRPCRLFQ